MATVAIFDVLDARLDAVLESGFTGPDADSASRAIAAGRFARDQNAVHLLAGDPARKPAYGLLDRTYRVAWRGVGRREDVPGASERDSPWHRVVRGELVALYVCGKGNEGHVRRLVGAETAANAVLFPERRALSDAERIVRALEWNDLLTDSDGGALPVDPFIEWCLRRGESVTEALDACVLACRTELELGIRLNPSTSYDWA